MPRALLLSIGICLFWSATAARSENPNELTDAEKQAGFELIFNGRDFTGWQQSGNWKIEEGAISRADKGGSLTYTAKKIPDDFELRFQWKVAPGSNSGVYYRPGQYEYQILDNRLHRDGQNPRTSAASLYFGVAPSKDATRPVGEWNDGRIVCRGTVIQHWLNGEKVVDLDYADPSRADEVALLKRRGGDVAARGALLSLQDHGDPVWYRGLKLRTVSADEPLDRAAVVPAAIPESARKYEREVIERLEKSRETKKE